MRRIEMKIIQIGNSRGIRLPAALIERYHFSDSVVAEEHPEGVLLRTHAHAEPKLSWADTASAMAASAEDWSAWESVGADGLREIPWQPGRGKKVAERPAKPRG